MNAPGALDALYLERACELARRALGSTAPNPPVGAVIVGSDGAVAGEGYHHGAGEPHAEVLALRAAGESARGATLYVTLEPCNHHGRTPPCSQAVISAGIARVVAGVADPNPKTDGAGIAALRAAGIAVEIADNPAARAIAAPFARAIRSQRPFVTLKMAMSLDGYAGIAGRREWLTGEEARAFVRELRIDHDAVAVGAGTVRVDDPRLTVRPPHARQREYVRVVFCETDGVDAQRSVFEAEEGYARTIVLVPQRVADAVSSELRHAADVAVCPDRDRLDLVRAMNALYERGITSVLLEGGPTLAREMLAAGLVDRFCWLIAARFLGGGHAIPVLAGEGAIPAQPVIERVERLGGDLLLCGRFDGNV